MYQISLRCILPLACGTSTQIMRTGLNVNSRHQMSRRKLTVLVAICAQRAASRATAWASTPIRECLQDFDDVVRAEGFCFLPIGRNRDFDARRRHAVRAGRRGRGGLGQRGRQAGCKRR